MPNSPAKTDGRRAKGERRRALLIEASLRVIEAAGIGGVTHRAVAAEAGLPPAAATYYFDSIDDLLLAALHSANRTYALALAELPTDAGLKPLAELMATLCDRHRARVVAEYELCLLAARRLALRDALVQWKAIIEGYLGHFSDDPLSITTAAAAFDGLLSHALVADRPPPAAEFQAALECILT